MRTMIDLTFPVHEGMMTFHAPWHPTVEVVQLGSHEKEKRETRKLVLGTHTGTHLDAPRHFIPGGDTVDQIPLDVLIGQATVLDFSGSQAKSELSPEDLEERLDGRSAMRIVLRFDWSKQYGKAVYYKDHPYLSSAAARWLVASGTKLLAMDTPMPDNPLHGKGNRPDSPIHKILLGAGIILVEYLSNLASLSTDEIELIVLPLKISGGDGSPVRCVAIENRE